MIGAHTGLPWPAIYHRRGGGGGDYKAKAVHLDGLTYLSNSALVTPPPFTAWSYIGWQRIIHNDNPFKTLFADGAFLIFGLLPPLGAVQIFSNNVGGTSQLTVSTPNDVDPADGAWACFIYSADIGHDSGSRPTKYYMGDVDETTIYNDTGTAFTIDINGTPFTFGDDGFGDGVKGDYADIRIMPGISLLDGGGDIPLATRRLFIDDTGKPVDPAIATAALGTPGAILFSGDANTFGNNQGTGGAFSLIGGPLTNASTSPSD